MPALREGTLSLLAGWPLRRPRWALILALLISVGAAFALQWLERDTRLEKLFPERDPRLAEYEAFRDTFGAEEEVALCLLEQSSPALERASLARIDSLRAVLAQLPVVDAERLLCLSNAPLVEPQGEDDLRIAPLYEAEQPRSPAALEGLLGDSPLVSGRLVSRDRKVSAFVVPLAPGLEGTAARRRLAQAVRATFAPERLQPGEQALFLGLPVTQDRILTLISEDARSVLPLACLVVFLVLALCLRHLGAALLSLGVVLLAVLWTLGAMALVGFPITSLSLTVPVLVLVAGVGDSVHLFTRFAQLLEAGVERSAALGEATREVWAACFLTSTTTALGFASLGISQVESVRELGFAVAFGILAAFVATFLVLPPLLAATLITPRGLVLGWLPTQLGRFAAAARQRRRGVAVAALLGGLCAGWLAAHVPRDTHLLEGFDSEEPLVVARDFFEERFGGAVPLELTIDASSLGSALEPALQRSLLGMLRELRGPTFREQGLLSAVSLPDFLADAYARWGGRTRTSARVEEALPDSRQALAQLHFLYWGLSAHDPTRGFVDDPEQPQHLRVELRVENLLTSDLFRLVQRVEALAKARLPAGVRARVTGVTLLAKSVSRVVVSELLQSMGLALLLVGGLLGVAFRSWRLALLGALASFVPLLGVVGGMTLSGTVLSLSACVALAVVFGICVDDTIHLIAGWQERRTDARALERTLEETGAAMVATSLALALGVAVLATSAFHANRTLGLLLASTVTLALACDVLLLPALLSWTGSASASTIGESAPPLSSTQEPGP
jgi:predicted RND superfamily exporter protein